MTAEELLLNDIPNKSTELVRGVVVERDLHHAGHGMLAARLAAVLGDYVYAHDAGLLIGRAGFWIERDPDTVRAPDVAFVSAGRASAIGRHGYAPIAPDLAVEILSPDDRPADVLRKVADWLRAGTRLVWVIDADRALTRVHRADGSISIVPEDGALDGEDVLPGFSCPLAELLA